MKKGKLKECAVTVLYDPHAATDHRVDMLDQLASQELPQVPLGKLKKASVISLDHAKKATHNESVKHPEILSDMIRLQNLIPETKHDNVTPSSKHDVIKTTKKWHDPHEAVSSTTVENGPQYISMAQEQDEEAVRSGKPIPPPKPLYTKDHDLDQYVPSSKHTRIVLDKGVSELSTLETFAATQSDQLDIKKRREGTFGNSYGHGLEYCGS